jgi:C-terminal peptidase prc
MTHALGFDTHSELWTPEEYQKFAESIDQNYAGIGAYVGVRDGELTVINPIYSGPAYKAGLRSGDRILAVEGEPTDDVTVDTVIKKLKGALNQPIVIRIQREGWTEPRDITIIRQMIQISSCKWTLLPENIAYCWLTQFGDKTAEELEAALKTMEGQGMKACILDLRQNGGGYLQTAIDVVGLFVKNNTLVVWSEGRNTEIAPRNNLYSRCKSPKESLPLVCLINGNSASSSEITAGALKVHQRATLIGERSYGKGTVQQPLPLEQWLGAYLKLTIARYYLPNGRSIHKEKDREGNIIQGKEGGIKPDIEVPMRKGEPWLNEAYQLVKRSKKLENFVSTHYEKERPLFQKLAENDFRDPALYPEFEALYLSLETKASRDDVRRWLRELVKVRAADDRGSEFVGDFNEDPQLQRAILEILFQLKKDPRTLPAYRAFISEYQALIQSQKFD